MEILKVALKKSNYYNKEDDHFEPTENWSQKTQTGLPFCGGVGFLKISNDFNGHT